MDLKVMTSKKNDDCVFALKAESQKNRPPAYHVFTVLGEYFVFDTSTQLLYGISYPTFRLLQECLTSTLPEAKEKLLFDKEFSPETIEAIVGEVAILAENGLFDAPNYKMSRKHFKKMLDARYKMPFSQLMLGLTESCNLACVYCYCGTRRDASKKRMNQRVAREAIDWFFRLSEKEKNLTITFFGGEPLMNKPVMKYAVEYSQKLAKQQNKNIRYNMTSNVTLIDDEFAEFLKKYNFGVLISLDGPESIHDAQCPTRAGNGSFAQAADGARKIFSYSKKNMVRCTLTKPVLRITELVDFFADFGFSSCYLGPTVNAEGNETIYDFSDEDYLDFDLQNEAMIPEILRKMEAGETLTYNHYGKFVDKFEKRSNRIFPSNCGACGGCLYVNVDGSLYPCHHYYGMEPWKIGSIYEELNIDLLKDYWRRFRKSTKKCETCWAGLICQGPCSANQMKKDGNFSSKINFCESRKFILERAAYIFYKKKFFGKNKETAIS